MASDEIYITPGVQWTEERLQANCSKCGATHTLTFELHGYHERVKELERERDEAREEGQDWNTQRQKLLLEKYELKALCRDGKESLAWALDLLDMYDAKLIQMGERPKDVFSQVHLGGKAMARDCEKRMRKAGGE
jgi:hypothetical protein